MWESLCSHSSVWLLEPCVYQMFLLADGEPRRTCAAQWCQQMWRPRLMGGVLRVHSCACHPAVPCRPWDRYRVPVALFERTCTTAFSYKGRVKHIVFHSLAFWRFSQVPRDYILKTCAFPVLSMGNLDHRCFPRKILLEVSKILYYVFTLLPPKSK